MASFVYNRAARKMADGTYNVLTATVKAVLVDATYTPDRDHDFMSSATTAELSGTGYVTGFGGSGRHTLAGKSFSEDDVNDRAEFTCTNPAWTAINAGTARYMLLVIEGTADTDTELVACIDSADFPKATNGGDLTCTVNAEGLLQWSTV